MVHEDGLRLFISSLSQAISAQSRKLIVQLLFAAEDDSLHLENGWSEALQGAKVREARKSQNLQAGPCSKDFDDCRDDVNGGDVVQLF